MKLKIPAAPMLLLIAAGQLWAAQINFTSGTPALAADVNANFTELYNSMWTKTGADLSYSGGNVGIGVVSPASAFHVNGHGLFDTYNNSAGSPGQVGIRRARGSFGAPSALQSGDEIGYFITRGHDGTGFFNTTIIVSRATENWNASGHGSNMGFLVTPTGSTSYVERLTIAQNGNIGIGTTSPGAKFHLTQTGGTSNDGLRLTAGATNWNTYIDGAGRLKIESTGGSNISFQDDGKVGIGATSPGAQLHVNATAAGATGITNARQNATAFLRGSNGAWGLAIGSIAATNEAYLQAMDEVQGSGHDLLLNPYNAGRIGIRTNAITSTCNLNATLCVNGQVWSNSTQLTSDSRWKKNVVPVSVQWSSFMSLAPSAYSWRKHEFPDMNFEDGRQFGFIAQNIEKHFPDLVRQNGKGFKSLNYSGLIAINTAAIQELKREKDAQIIALKDELAKKDARIARLERLESRLASIETRLNTFTRR
ncbi:MAG: tail fiber domain-containing protein [Turneriella sp.]